MKIANNLTQEYQEVVFSRFVCILLLFGCCMFLGIISVSLNVAMSAGLGMNTDSYYPEIHIDPEEFWVSVQIFSLLAKGLLVIFASFVPILACCCCLGMKSPQGNFCARVTFYISTAIIGSFLFITMLNYNEVLLYWAATRGNNIIIQNNVLSTVGYYLLYAITGVNFLAVILCLAMIITAMRACIKDPQRMCSNQFVQVGVYIKFLLVSATLASIITSIPAMVTLSSIEDILYCFGSPPQNISKLEAYTSAAISFNGAHLVLVLLFVRLVGPLFCILEVRKSPLFSTILKYVITLSWVISFALFASGILLAICTYLVHESRNELKVELHSSVVVSVFALSAAVNFTVAMIITIIWFLCTCSSCVHAIVLCCCLFYNLLN